MKKVRVSDLQEDRNKTIFVIAWVEIKLLI